MAKSTFNNATRAHYEAIRQQEQVIRALEYSEEVLKRRHAAAKKDRELAQARLHEMCGGDPDAMDLPGKGDQTEKPLRPKAGWQGWAVSIAIHDKAILDALAADEIETLGQLQKFLIDNDHKLTKIAGISEMMEAKATEQLDLFWASNPEGKAE